MLFSCSFYEVKKEMLASPENLRVENLMDTSAVICWDKVSNADEYYIEIQCVSEQRVIESYWIESAEYKFSDLLWEETYEVSVRAISEYEETYWGKYKSSETKKITFKTLPKVFPFVPADEINYVKNISVVQNKDKTITFSWEKVDGAVFYDIICEHFEDEDSSDYFYVTLDASQAAYTDTEVGDVFKVRYYICGRNETFSNECRWNITKKIKVSFDQD